jgi:hypothetical protein
MILEKFNPYFIEESCEKILDLDHFSVALDEFSFLEEIL